VSDITNAGGRAISLQADVSREDQVIAMFKKLIATYGTIDILVSNAGIQKDSAFADMTLQQWNAVIGVNLTGGFLCAREAVKEFLRRGVVPERSKAAGKIIFTSSVHEVIPWAGHANYASSKGGMMMLMKTIAQELAPKKIRVNGIGPGAIETPINESVWSTPEGVASMCKLIPYGRIGETTDVAPVAVWLASDQADYITGTTVFVDGGMLLYPGFRTGG
jgi:glucose 1-dehydrogenase